MNSVRRRDLRVVVEHLFGGAQERSSAVIFLLADLAEFVVLILQDFRRQFVKFFCHLKANSLKRLPSFLVRMALNQVPRLLHCWCSFHNNPCGAVAVFDSALEEIEFPFKNGFDVDIGYEIKGIEESEIDFRYILHLRRLIGK